MPSFVDKYMSTHSTGQKHYDDAGTVQRQPVQNQPAATPNQTKQSSGGSFVDNYMSTHTTGGKHYDAPAAQQKTSSFQTFAQANPATRAYLTARDKGWSSSKWYEQASARATSAQDRVRQIKDQISQLTKFNEASNAGLYYQTSFDPNSVDMDTLQFQLASAQRTLDNANTDLDYAKQWRYYDEDQDWYNQQLETSGSWGNIYEGMTRGMETLQARRQQLQGQIAQLENEQQTNWNASAVDGMARPDRSADLEKARADLARIDGYISTNQRRLGDVQSQLGKDRDSASYAAAGRRVMQEADERYNQQYVFQEDDDFAEYEAKMASRDDDVALKALRPTDEWTNDEKQTFYIIAGRIGQSAAEDYAADINYQKNRAAVREQTQGAREWGAAADSSRAGKVGAGAAGIAAQVAATPVHLLSWIDKIDQTAKQDGRYTGRNRALLSDYASAIVEGRAGQLNQDYGTINAAVPVLGGKGVGDLYQLSASIAQSMALGNIAGETATLVAFFGQAADSSFDEAIDRGASGDQAMLYSFLSGAAEVAGEKISLENLLDSKKGLMQSTFKTVLQQAGIEGSEEGMTDILNLFNDELAARMTGGKSEVAQKISEKMNDGMTYEEAAKAVWKDVAADVAWDVIGGTISGGASGGLQQVANHVVRYKADDKGRYAFDANAAQIVQEAKAAATAEGQTKLKQQAEKAQKTLDKGRKISVATATKLVKQTNRAAMVDAVEAQIKSRDTEMEAKTARSLANAVVAQVRSEKLTENQQKLVGKHTELNSALVKEMDINRPAEWAQSIGVRGPKAMTEAYGDRNLRNAIEDVQKYQGNVKDAMTVKVDGVDATITDVTRGEDGAITGYKVEYSDGKTQEVKAGDVNLSQAQTLVASMLTSSEYSEPKIRNMDNGQDVVEYSRDFDIAADAFGNSNTYNTFESAWKAIQAGGTVLTESQARAAWEAGQARKNSSPKATLRRRGTGKVSFESFNDGVTEYAEPSAAEIKAFQQTARYQVLADMAKAIGVDLSFFKAGSSKVNGKYEDGTVYLNMDASPNAKSTVENYVMLTAAHELTHYIRDAAPAQYAELKDFVVKHIVEQGKLANGRTLQEQIKHKLDLYQAAGQNLSVDDAIEEIVADACQMMLQDNTIMAQLASENRPLHTKITKWMQKFFRKLANAFRGISASSDEARAMEDAFKELQEIWNRGIMESINAEAVTEETEQAVENGQAISEEQEASYSLKYDEEFMDNAVKYNNDHGGFIDEETMAAARKARQLIADAFNDPSRALNLPEDVMGNTFISNSSYGGTEENTTVCIRSLAAQALMDQIGKALGRPLTVDETLLLSQEIANYTDKPECFYCYVAMDRRAYREYLNNYLQQRDAVLKKAGSIKTDADRQALYQEFLEGRKDTKNMRSRFNLWLNTAQENLITGTDIASLDDLAREIAELQQNKHRTPVENSRLRQLKDAAAYAQSASWAKKVQGYTAYNGHILKWNQKKINDFNSHYGLRMYSFSDFSAAFILENMQMVTDASVKGLKMLAYTKEIAFAEIFAQTGMNINISVYASHANGQIIKDGMQGADWDQAIALRDKYPNVGLTLVATSDDILQWGLAQPEIDVVIPYHLVRTGQHVADYFGFKNYTSVSADGKLKAASEYKGKPTSVYPSEHQNDLVAYVRALQKYDLTPRFEDYLTGWKEFLAGDMSEEDFRAANPYYMKLVNETRRSAQDTPAVQPVFNTEAAMDAINLMERKGGYGIAEIFGKSADFVMEDIVDTVTEKINAATQAAVRAQREAAKNQKPKLSIRAVEETGIEEARPDVAFEMQAAAYSIQDDERVNPDGITYDGIGERYFAYDEGDRLPDLTPVETQYRKWDDKIKDFKWVKDVTIRFAGDRPKNYVPRRVGRAYKVMEMWPDGTVHPLFAGADVPIEFGNWQWGKGYKVDGMVKTMGLRPRYAWHISTLLPTAAHLMGVGDSLNPQPIYPSKGGPHPKGSKRVWVELEYDASTDYNGLVDTLGSSDGDVLGLMPFGGYYVYKEKNMSEWVLSSGVRFTRVLEESERQQILKDAGYDEYEAWQKGKLSQTIAGQITNTKKALDKEADPSKRAALQAKLDRLNEINSQNPYAGWKAPKYTKAEGDAHLQQVRESVASRIYDNPDATRQRGKFSFAGQESETADRSLLNQAEQMEREGRSSEEIRQATGWFRGMDDIWRYEISNREMKITRAYDPNVTSYKLWNLIDHASLFAAYPSLQEINIEVGDYGNADGVYTGWNNTISVDSTVFADKKKLRSVLVHEIQHAIQAIEGFARGTSPEYWQSHAKDQREYLENRVYTLEQQTRKAAEELDQIYKDIGYEAYEKELDGQVWLGEITDSEAEEMLRNYVRERSSQGYALMDLYDTLRNEMAAAKRELYSMPSSYSLYERTAGEIEARDVSKRLTMDDETRRSRRPDIDRNDVVFARYSIQDGGFDENEVTPAVYGIRYEAAERGRDFVQIGTMPKLYQDLFDLTGPVYVSNSHLYRDMVSKETAIKEGRYESDASADYHDLGEERIIDSIMQFADPIAIMESLKDYTEPRLVSVLYEKGNDQQNLIGVLELYRQASVPGGHRRNHVLFTIYEKSNLPEYIDLTTEKNRLLYVKEGLPNDTLAGVQFAGKVSREVLNRNVAQFKKKVKDFKTANNIKYSIQDDDYIPYNRRAVVSEETLDKWMSGSYFGSSNPNYAQAYITYMRPGDFLALTTIYDADRLRSETEALDADQLVSASQRQPIQLKIDTETGKVIDHEGRHRMIALQRAGVEHVPVLLFDSSNKYTKTPLDSLRLYGQDFNGMRNSSRANVYDVLPLNQANRSAIVATYSRQEPFERSAEKLGMRQQIRFQIKDESEVTDRELLANTLMEDVTNPGEKRRLQNYKAKLTEYAKYRDELEEAEAALREARHLGDKEKIRTAQAERNKLNQRLINIDSKLTELELTKPMKELLTRVRQDARTRQRATTREGKSKSEMRQKIRRLHESMSNQLLKPSENRYVPKPLLKTVAEILEMVNTDSGRSEKMKVKLAELNAQYSAIKQSNEYGYAFDDTVAEMITQLTTELAGMDNTSIYKMTQDQLKMVYDTMKAINHTIRYARKMIAYETNKDMFEIARGMMQETDTAGPINSELFNKWLNASMRPETFFKRMAGYRKNSNWEMMADMLDKAQLKQTQIQMESAAIFEELMKDTKALDKMTDEKNLIDIGLKDQNGEAVLVTMDIALKIYMDTLAEDNARHLMYGGYTVPNIKTYYKGKASEAYGKGRVRVHGFGETLSDLQRQLNHAETAEEKEDIQLRIDIAQAEAVAWVDTLRQNIWDQMGEYEKKWVQAATKYFNEYSQRVLNETTMAVYGFEKATVKNYVPIHTDAAYRTATFENIARDMSLENSGFMKQRIMNAANPMVAEGLVDVIASQIDHVAKYAAMMPAVRNFTKVYGKSMSGYTNSVQEAVLSKFGKGAAKYIENIVTDLTSPRTTEGGMLGEYADRLRGNLAAASLTLNPRVTLGQAASYPTAAAVVGWKALGKALKDVGSNPMYNEQARQEIAKWSPLLWYRMQGFFDQSVGEGRQSTLGKAMSKAKFLTGWIEAADGWTVGQLWYAAQYYVEDHTDLERGTDAFMEETAKVYNRIIEQTQPNYTAFQRPDILRNPNAIVKQVTMFMTQRLQNVNILYDAVGTYNAAIKDYRAGKHGTTESDVAEARDGVIRAVTSQVAATTTLIAFKLLADALMYSMKAYRDDDDELTEESIRNQFFENLLESFASNFLWGSELYALSKSLITGERYYGISLNGVDTFNKVLTDVVGLRQAPSWDQLWKVGKDASQMMGIPLNNAAKFVNAVKYRIDDVQNGDGWGTYASEIKLTDERRGKMLYNALVDGNTEAANRQYEYFGDKAAANRQLVKHIKDLYSTKELSEADAIAALQKYTDMSKYDSELEISKLKCELETGVKYTEMRQKFVDGEITDKEAIDMRVKYGKEEKDQAAETVQKWKLTVDTGYDFDKLQDYIAANDISEETAAEYLIKYGGKDADSAISTVSKWMCEIETGIPYDKIEDYYAQGLINRQQLIHAYTQYGLYDDEKAELVADKRDFVGLDEEMESITTTAVQKYMEFCDPADVERREFYDAWKAANAFTSDKDEKGNTISGSVLRKKIAYIDSLGLEPYQKTAIALAIGITAKQLKRYKAAWI